MSGAAGGLLECVPNFSEGRREEVVAALLDAMASAPGGGRVLHWCADPSHNRCVVTLAGPRDGLVEMALAGARAARDLIDLRVHEGRHPRIGALDVCPFVPLEGSTMEEAVAAAGLAGRRIAKELDVPVFLYGRAALVPARGELPELRRGGLDGLTGRMNKGGAWAADFGPPAPHPTAGVCAVGARWFLIAFNVLLATADAAVARRIAARVRERDGGLPGVRALGLHLPHKGLAQVSMNLLDFRRTSPRRAFDAVAAEAASMGVDVLESELVGLAPGAALDEETARHVKLRDFDGARHVLEAALQAGHPPPPPGQAGAGNPVGPRGPGDPGGSR